MAASGQTVTAPVSAMSGATAAPAAGPMQADKTEKRIARHMNKGMALSKKMDTVEYESDAFNKLSAKMAKERDKVLRLSKGKQAPYWGMHLPRYGEQE